MNLPSRKYCLAMALLLGACSSADDKQAEPSLAKETPAADGAAATPPAMNAPAIDPAALALLKKELGDGDTKYSVASRDLNGDGKPELIVYAYGSDVCGTGGCNLFVLTPAADGWSIAANTSVTNPPVKLLASSTNGWRDLSVAISGGGIEAAQIKLAFDGKAYPENPTVLPASEKVNVADGEELIADPFAQ